MARNHRVRASPTPCLHPENVKTGRVPRSAMALQHPLTDDDSPARRGGLRANAARGDRDRHGGGPHAYNDDRCGGGVRAGANRGADPRRDAGRQGAGAPRRPSPARRGVTVRIETSGRPGALVRRSPPAPCACERGCPGVVISAGRAAVSRARSPAMASSSAGAARRGARRGGSGPGRARRRGTPAARYRGGRVGLIGPALPGHGYFLAGPPRGLKKTG